MADWRGQHGFALPSVLMIAILISLFALTLTTLARVLASDGATLSSEVHGRAATEAGLNRIILAFSHRGDFLRESLVPDGRPVAWEFHGGALRLRAQAESGKLDINAADRTHIVALLGRVLEDANLQAQSIARIDNARRSGVRMTAVADLLSPFDRMTTKLDLLNRYFTVMTNQRGFDPVTAPSLVIESIPELPDETKRSILDARIAQRPLPLADIPAPVAQRFAAERPLYTFYAEKAGGPGRATAMSALVGFSEQTGLSVYSWAPASVQR